MVLGGGGASSGASVPGGHVWVPTPSILFADTAFVPTLANATLALSHSDEISETLLVPRPRNTRLQ